MSNSRGNFILFTYLVYNAHFTKFSIRGAVRSRRVHRKIKSRKKSLGGDKQKKGLKKKVRASFLQEKKNILAESDKISWFDQEPLISSASA